MKNKLFILILLVSILFSACKEDEDPIQLVASAGDSQTVKPLEQVTLDGTGSTGPEGFTYSWTYSGDVPETEINFQNKNSATPTFTPPKGEIYYFTLTTTSSNQVSSDEVTVVASGGIEIGGTLTQDLALVDIEPDAEVPDYIVTSDIIVPNGITLSVADENVLVYFELGSGMHVKDGGKLTNMIEGRDDGLNVIFSGDKNDGWKGIWIENGVINLNHATINFGGISTFEGQGEAAALILSGAQTNLMSMNGNDFNNSYSYDILVPDYVGGEGLFQYNSLSYKFPMKAHVTFVEHFNSSHPNIYPDTYDYNIMVPSGPDTKDNIEGYGFRFDYGKFLINGDFWAGNDVSASDATIYIKEGCGIITEGSLNFRGPTGGTMTITGMNDAHWKGMAVIGSQQSLFLTRTIVKNGGYGLLQAGDFIAEENATIYGTAWSGKFEDSKIIDGGGFGYYNSDTTSNYVAMSMRNVEFINLAKAAIRTNVPSVSRLFTYNEESGVTFDLDSNVPAILVQGDGKSELTWQNLGVDNFYLIDANIRVDAISGFTLEPGVIMKFRSGRYFKYSPGGSGSAQLVWLGTQEEPIILEGEHNEPGSWGGIYLGGTDAYFHLDHCIIRNGGEFVLPDATEKANMTSAYQGAWEHLVVFTNNTISGSAGYGIVVEENTTNFDYDDPGKNNEFYDNASGDILIK